MHRIELWRWCGVVALTTGAVLIAGCNDNDSTDNSPTTGGVLPGNTVGPNGGVLEFMNGAVRMEFPAGAVAADTTITVTSSTAVAPSFPATLPAHRYDFGPNGITFSKPVRVTVQYDAGTIPAGVKPTWLQLAKLSGESWQPVSTQVDTTARTISGEMTGFSAWAITTFPGQLKRVRFPDNGQKSRIYVRDLAVDPQGNTIVVGDSQDMLDGSTPINGGYASFVARYAPGFSLSWLKPLDSTGADYVARVAVTPTGVIAIAGSTTGAFAATAPAWGTATYLTTLTPDGNTRAGWPVQLDIVPSGTDYVNDLIASALEEFAMLVNYPGPPLRTGLASYNSSGIQRGLAPVGFEAPADIVLQGLGLGASNVGNYVLAQTWPVSKPNPSWTGWALTGLNLNNSGTMTGYPLHQGETETGRPQAMAIDSQGNVFVAAFSDDTQTRLRISSFTSDGKPRSGWPVEFAVEPDTRVKSMKIDPTGNLFLAGKTRGGLGGTNAGGTDIFIVSYNPAGVLRSNWPIQFGTAGDDDVVRMTVDGQGAVVLAGRLDTGGITSEGSDYFIARLLAF